MTIKPYNWICEKCGGDYVWRAAWAEWDLDEQCWSLIDGLRWSPHRNPWCVDCDGETTIKRMDYVPPDEGKDD